MTLLNGLLAFGAFAFTIPLAIHLLFRSRFTTIDWGAMHLLDSVVRINRKRIQLMNLLLLLLRCLLPILLAICLARPVLTGFRSLPGNAPRSMVLVVDDSRSMSARDLSGITRMERAKTDLVDLVSGLSRRDEVILIPSSLVDTPAASMGSQEALARIAELDTHSGPVDLGRLMRAAVEAASEASHVQQHIIIASDFPSENVSDAAMRSVASSFESTGQRGNSPAVSFLNYGIDSNQLSNVSVDSITVESPAVVARRGARFSAQIRNASDTPLGELRLVWFIDGSPLRPRSISIPPRSTATSRLTHRIDEPGVHQVTVSVEHGDALAADNRRSIAVDVTQEIKVLLVDGDPSRRPLQGETDFLAIALSPFAFGGEDLPDAVRTRVVTTREMVGQIKDELPDILVLANVKELRGDNASVVAQFVFAGGSLIVFDGDAVDAASYNAGWSCEDGRLTLPAQLGETLRNPASDDSPRISIGELNDQYTPWNLLESTHQQPLSQVIVDRYRKLMLPAKNPQTDDSITQTDELTSQDDAPTITWLSMSNGDPLVVSASRGRGQVVQFGVPCDSDWTTLPMRMVYLPMVQQLVMDLAGTRKNMTIDVGSGFAVPIHEFKTSAIDGEQVDSQSPPTYTVQLPDTVEQSMTPTDEFSPQLVVLDAAMPGAYRFRKTIQPKAAEPLVANTLRIVEVPAEESQLRDTDPKRLAAAAKIVDAEIYHDMESLRSKNHTRRFGRELWRLLLIALLVGMVAELFLQQHSIRRVRRTA